MNKPYINDFTVNGIIDKMNNIEEQLIEERGKSIEERDRSREFELMYARFMAGLKLNTGIKIF